MYMPLYSAQIARVQDSVFGTQCPYMGLSSWELKLLSFIASLTDVRFKQDQVFWNPGIEAVLNHAKNHRIGKKM